MNSFEGIILMLTCGQGLLLSLALFSSYWKNKYSNLFTGILVAVLTIEIATRWSMRMGYFSDPNAFPYYILGSYLLLPPSLYLIIKTNLYPSFRPSREHVLLFVPAFVDIVAHFTSQYMAVNFGKSYLLYNYTGWFFYSEILPAISTLLVVLYFGLAISKLPNNIFNYRNLSPPVKRVLGLFIFSSALMILWLSTLMSLPYHQTTQIWIIAFLFSFGYLGYIYPRFFSIPEIMMPQAVGDEFMHLSDQEELARVRHALEVDKIYRTPRLSVKMLAQHLNLPERYVSRLINQNYNKSFNSYVNQYRVNDIIERLECSEDSHKTLVAIAEESGFSSKSSFNSVFKEVTGKNPSQYLRK